MSEVTDTAVESAPEATEEESNQAPVDSATVEAESEEAQDEVVYAGKYKSVEDLEKGYNEMQRLYNSRYKGFTGAPEDGYTINEIEGLDKSEMERIVESPVFMRFQERGLERGMSNDMFNEVVADFIVSQKEEIQANLEYEISKLGKDAQKRIDNVVSKLGTVLEGTALDAMKNSLTTAESIEAMETLLNRDVNSVSPASEDVSAPDKEAELNDLWVAVDSRGRRKMEYDAEYRKMVNRKFKDYYGD